MNKGFIKLSVILLGFLLLGAGALFYNTRVTKIEAQTPSCTWTDWKNTSDCKANSCGTTEGTQSQERICEQEVCDLSCPVVNYQWDTKACPTADSAYTSNNNNLPCKKKINNNWKYANEVTTNHDVNVTYDKSNDPSKCHRPSDNDLNSIYGMTDSSTRNDFKSKNGEWKDAIKSNCQNETVDKQTKDGVKCEATLVACGPKDQCENIDGIQETVPDGYYQSKDNCYQKKGVTVVQACDGSVLVTINGGDTRRTWRVEGVEAWIDYNQTHTFNATTLDVKIEWKHNNQWEQADESYVTRTGAGSCEQPKTECIDVGYGCGGSPSFPHDQGVPQCGDATTVNLPANPHVLRNGGDATVNFFVTQGNKANIYYKEVGEADWTHSVIGLDVGNYKDNFISYTIHDLDPNVGYVFGIQQVQGCGGGQTITAVIIDGPASQTFSFSYWEWTK